MRQRAVFTIVFLALSAACGLSALFLVFLKPCDHRNNSMRLAFPYNRNPENYDPARITLAPEYIFLENIFSPLIEMDVHGSVTSGVASMFEWQGDEAVLTIRDSLVTVDGLPITAQDAEFSLKRLLVLTGNTHGNIQDLLCADKPLKSVDEPCQGIESRGNQLILRPGRRKPFLFPMLAAIDFAVIPRRSVNPETLAIIDFRNTSGPYYVAADAGGGYITLKANPQHYHYNDRIPQNIKLVPMDPDDPNSSLSALEHGEIDALTTIDAATPEAVLQFHNSRADRFNLHQTLNIRNIMLTFTEYGRKIFTPEVRRCIGQTIRHEFLKHVSDSLAYKPEVQFFPVVGEGGLSASQLAALKHAFTCKDVHRY